MIIPALSTGTPPRICDTFVDTENCANWVIGNILSTDNGMIVMATDNDMTRVSVFDNVILIINCQAVTSVLIVAALPIVAAMSTVPVVPPVIIVTTFDRCGSPIPAVPAVPTVPSVPAVPTVLVLRPQSQLG
jgi:hypothetical protein